jgi:integrase
LLVVSSKKERKETDVRGHLRERSPGHWAIVIDTRDPQSGERRRRWHSFKGTKREAQLRCAQLIAEAQTGTAIHPDKITVAQFLDRFQTDWVATRVSPHTCERYGYNLSHARRHIGERPLQKLRPADLATFYATLARDEGLAPRTVRSVHVILHQALERAKIWGVIRDNPADLAKPPRPAGGETPMLQPDQAAVLLERLRGKPLFLIASLGLATGMRRNEMLALRWRDINLDGSRLTIEQSLEQTRALGVRTKAPKTERGRRTIALPAHIVTELRQHWREQQEQRLGMGLGKAPDDSPVFAAADGRHLSPNAITKRWPRAMAAIGMPAVTLHSLRHTHASMLIAKGVDILTISRRLGHSSPTITLGVYGHLIHGTDDRAAAIMDEAFGSKMVAGNARKPEK